MKGKRLLLQVTDEMVDAFVDEMIDEIDFDGITRDALSSMSMGLSPAEHRLKLLCDQAARDYLASTDFVAPPAKETDVDLATLIASAINPDALWGNSGTTRSRPYVERDFDWSYRQPYVVHPRDYEAFREYFPDLPVLPSINVPKDPRP